MTWSTKILLAGVALSLLGGGFGSGPVLAVGLALFIVGIIAKLAG
jgi:hypothetical protein